MTRLQGVVYKYAHFLCSRMSKACSLPDQRDKIVST
eukprot:COSAG02_NODE_4996_length_4738_cov_2.522526_4_plen_36_part_00